MATRRLGIIMNGVTGRMGTNQHLVRSVLVMRAQGGVALSNGAGTSKKMPAPKRRGLWQGAFIAPWD